VLSERDRPEACGINFITPDSDEGGLAASLLSQFVTLCVDLFVLPRRYNGVKKIGANITARNSIR
jgi:hypothetical protein